MCAACDNADISDPGDIDETADTASITTKIVMPYPITIGGTEITRSPQKVVVLSPYLVEIVCEMGYGSRIAGRGSYADYPPEIVSSPTMGSSADPDFSAIKSVSPDILMTSTPIVDKDVFDLANSGITTLFIPAPTSISAFLDVYKAVGLLFEGAALGDESGVFKGEQAFSPISKALNNSSVVNVGSFVYVTAGLRIATGDTLESAVLSCFGTNAAAPGSDYAFDKAQLLNAENAPDVIFLSDVYSAQDLLADETFSQLNAARDNRIILLDNSCFERPSGRIVALLSKMIVDYRALA